MSNQTSINKVAAALSVANLTADDLHEVEDIQSVRDALAARSMSYGRPNEMNMTNAEAIQLWDDYKSEIGQLNGGDVSREAHVIHAYASRGYVVGLTSYDMDAFAAMEEYERVFRTDGLAAADALPPVESRPNDWEALPLTHFWTTGVRSLTIDHAADGDHLLTSVILEVLAPKGIEVVGVKERELTFIGRRHRDDVEAPQYLVGGSGSVMILHP